MIVKTGDEAKQGQKTLWQVSHSCLIGAREQYKASEHCCSLNRESEIWNDVEETITHQTIQDYGIMIRLWILLL